MDNKIKDFIKKSINKENLSYLKIDSHSDDIHDNKNKYLLAAVLFVLILNVSRLDNEQVMMSSTYIDDDGVQFFDDEADRELASIAKDQVIGERKGIAKSPERLFSNERLLYLNERIDHDGNFIYEVFYVKQDKEEKQHINEGLMRFRK